jgi:DNA-directed RNA polymerase specialized sigma24 family protein
LGSTYRDGDIADGEAQVADADADPDIRLADTGLVDRLRESGFDGESWRTFAEELFLYGRRVLRRWFADGTIVARCRQLQLVPSSVVWHGWSLDDQHDLLMDTLTNSVAAFREVLRRDLWDPSRGASLRTYFVGQALRQFARVYLRFLDDRQRMILVDPDRLFRRGDVTAWMQPERVAVFRAEIEFRLAGLSNPRSRQVVLLDALGYSDVEIGSITGLSARAVEGRLRRARVQLRESSGASLTRSQENSATA